MGYFRRKEPKARISTTIPVSIYQQAQTRGIFLNSLIELGWRMILENEYLDPQEIPQTMRRMGDRIKTLNERNKLLEEKLLFYRKTKLEIERVYMSMTRVKVSRAAMEPIKKLVEFQG